MPMLTYSMGLESKVVSNLIFPCTLRMGAAKTLIRLHECAGSSIGPRLSSHYAVMQVHNKNSNIEGRSPNVVKVIFHNIRHCS